MLKYTIAVTCAILVSAVLMNFFFIRLKLLNFRILLSITLVSLVSAIALPGIFYIITMNQNGVAGISTLLLITVATIAIYVMLAFILSVIISHAIPGIDAKRGILESQISEAMPDETDMVKAATAEAKVKSASSEVGTANQGYLEQIYDTMVRENSKETTDYAENAASQENNFEKPVDSSGNIDKMGIENIAHDSDILNIDDSDILNIDECIEEAFRLKEQGDAEGAILYFMYALDKKPQKELTFWIVLDICVMYKSLGQYELAFDILNSYYDVFGDIMDVTVKEEIENNLSI